MAAPTLTFPSIANVATSTSKLPSTVNIFADKEGRNTHVACVDRNLIIKHSKTVRDILEANPAKSDILINGAAKGPLEHVIEFMKKGKQPLRIGVGHEPFAKVVAILQAVNALDVEPAQPQVENHVIYTITQFKITATQVFVIQEASARLGTDGRIYKAMVQAVAYNVLHDCFTAEELKGIKNVAVKYPDLDNAIKEKIEDLKRRAVEHEKLVEQRQAGREARERRQAEQEDLRQWY